MSARIRSRGTGDALSIREARALALRAQGIGPRPASATRSRLRSLLLQQGCVQLDSVSAVARAHELLAFSRLGPYDAVSLRRLVYGERLMFEYWGHAMSWLPMAEFRYVLPMMERFRAEPRRWWRNVREQHGDLYAAVVQRIRDEGPLPSSAFEDPLPGRDSWWDHKPAKLVLEDLFDQGVLMVSDRRSGFQRVYDLAERVIPPSVDTRRPSDEEAAAHLLLRAARALGVGALRDLADYFRQSSADARRAAAQLVERGDLRQVSVVGWPIPAYVATDVLSGSLRRPSHRPALLSPFDPLVWERARALRLFDFDYRLEIYTPEHKRRYGYYVLPLLADGSLIGRVDARNDRASATLRVPAAYLERGDLERGAQHLATALTDLARFLGANQIAVERTDPDDLLAPLRQLLDRSEQVETPPTATAAD